LEQWEYNGTPMADLYKIPDHLSRIIKKIADETANVTNPLEKFFIFGRSNDAYYAINKETLKNYLADEMFYDDGQIILSPDNEGAEFLKNIGNNETELQEFINRESTEREEYLRTREVVYDELITRIRESDNPEEINLDGE